jgi:hypothetical protein
MTDRNPNERAAPKKYDRYYAYCPTCEAPYPRGVTYDYGVDCECGKHFTVAKAGPR